MNVLSLFDGMSCGQIALNELGIIPEKYYAAEIKPHAIKVTKANFPNTIHIGDVRKVFYKDGVLETENGVFEVGKIDLLIGGSPCQDLSGMNKNQIGLAGDKSSLFWEYARIKKETLPYFFMLENVGSMPYNDAMTITKEMGVNGIRIDSSLVSAQQRDRIYWTNIPGDGISLFGGGQIEQPKDKNIKLKDILESGFVDRDKSLALLARHYVGCPVNEDKLKKYLLKRYKKSFLNVKWSDKSMNDESIEMLTQIEMERLQTVPEGYTKCLTHREASNVLGDGWTVEVIKHIFKNLPKSVSL